MIKLVEVTTNNFFEVSKLQVKDFQKTWVSEPLFTLAQCYVEGDEDVLIFAFESDQKIVGFLALITELEKKTMHIWRMLIGDQYQGQRFGRDALRAIEAYTKQLGQFDQIIADYVVGNEPMRYLLETEGYVEIGKQEEWNEVIMAKHLDKVI